MSQARDKSTGKFVKQAEATVDKAVHDQLNFQNPQWVGLEEPGADSQAQQFPTGGLSSADAADRANRLKFALQRQGDANTGITPFGEIKWDDKYAEWYLRKLEAAKKAAFQQWFAKNFDKWSPVQKKLARELYPQFYRERVQMLEKNLDMAKEVAKLKILGPQTASDVALQFALDQGMINPAFLNNIINPPSGDVAIQFARGYLNTNNFFFGTSDPDGAVALQGRPSSDAGLVPRWRGGEGAENAAVLRNLGFA